MRKPTDLTDALGHRMKVSFTYGSMTLIHEGFLTENAETFYCGDSTFKLSNVVRVMNGTIYLRCSSEN